jgi:hypothetical protein
MDLEKSGVANIPEGESPVIPQRPVRKSSVKSFKSQHSIEEELERVPSISETQPTIPKRIEHVSTDAKAAPTYDEPMEVEHETEQTNKNEPETEDTYSPAINESEKETAPPIEEIPNSPHQHPVIHARPNRDEQSVPAIPERPRKQEPRDIPVLDPVSKSIPVIPTRPSRDDQSISTLPEHLQKQDEEPRDASAPDETAKMTIPTPSEKIIPPRPTKKDPEQRSAGFAGLTSTPVIPARPSKPVTEFPTVAMDATPEIIQTEGGLFESVEEPIYSHRKPIEAETVFDTPIPTEAKDASSEIQTEVVNKPTKSTRPPIPARPAHKLARQFEQPIIKEKPIPPPRPIKGAASSRFAGLRAQFAKDLNEKLTKPPPLPPKKEEEEEIHSMETDNAKGVATEDIALVTEGNLKVADVRKGRARGPQRRPPTVKPIVPTGWGISTIATVFEQKDVPVQDKSEVQTQTAEEPSEVKDVTEGKADHAIVAKQTELIEEEAMPEVGGSKHPEEAPEVQLPEHRPQEAEETIVTPQEATLPETKDYVDATDEADPADETKDNSDSEVR